MWPYVYDRPQPTPWLWMSEGITDYYADLAEVRGGIVDERAFYGMTAAKITEVTNTAPVALHDASLNTWIHPVDGTQYIYYPKGSLAGLMLDVLIRDGSENKHSLDDVLRELYRTAYKAGHGFTGEEWWGAVSRAAGGRSFADFDAKYVDGREPYPWDQVLPLAGLHAVRDNTPRLGVSTQQDAAGIHVSDLEEGGAAAQAGVRLGDLLLAVGDIGVDDQQFGDKFRLKFATAPEGTPVSIKVRRAGLVITLPGKLRFAPGDYHIEALASATPKATRIRTGILRGTTDK
jgi:predicted metalloprotease with PDZ domain